MKILITGSRGFIGRHLCGFLKHKNYSILTPSRKELDFLSPNLVRDYLKKNKPKIIFHLASVGVSKEENKNKEVNISNVLMIKNIVNNLPSNCRLVVAGSMAEYGSSGVFRESDLCYPQTEYAKSKLEVTEYCLNKYNYSKDIIICRIFGAYGYGELRNRLFPSLHRSFINNKTCYLSDGKQKRDFIHVIDVCVCLLKIALISNENCEKIINIGTGKAVTVEYVVRKYAKSFSIDTHLLKFNAVDRSPGDADLLCANVDLLKSLINFVPPQRFKEHKDVKILFNKNAYEFFDKKI